MWGPRTLNADDDDDQTFIILTESCYKPGGSAPYKIDQRPFTVYMLYKVRPDTQLALAT